MTKEKPCIFCQGLKVLTIMELKKRVACPVCEGSGVFYYVDQEDEEISEDSKI